MNQLRTKIQNYTQEITFESLKKFIDTYDFFQLNYEDLLPEPEVEGDYGRHVITLDPFECVLVQWPAGTESGVHHHKGLFGYVLVLEGELDNVLYKETEDQLIEYSKTRFLPTGLMPEPDGVIHKITNASPTRRAVSLHFYYPALVTLENLRIFNLETGDVGILSKDAKTASWSEEEGHFKSVERQAFEYVPYEEFHQPKTHVISTVYPKPEADVINRMNGRYFSEQAEKYDFSDFNSENRKRYTTKINELVATDLVNYEAGVEKLIDVAAGTGRRAINIKKASGLDYEIVGVDISDKMCEIAESRGIRMYHQDWANDDPHSGEFFGAATYLYAFGHIATEENRIKTLQKIHSYLVPGAPFYLDIFNVDNENEWGPNAIKEFEEKQLHRYGYLKGDVFYQKLGYNQIAFLHYFSKQEITDLLNQTGFEIQDIQIIGYARNPGEITGDLHKGNFFIKAVRI